jgi:hypothetical protein
MRRLLTIAVIPVAAAIGSTALAVGLSGTAWATTPVNPTPGSSVACTGLKYNGTTGAATVSDCYTEGPVSTGKVYKELVAPSAETLLNGGTIPWSPGPKPKGSGTITTSSLTSVTPTGTCKAAKKGTTTTQAAYSGTVNSVAGAGNPVEAGDVVYVDVCINTNNTSGKLAVVFATGTPGEF